MNAVPFDTLKFARKLEASGMPSATAAGTAEALADAIGGAELATKTDIGGVRTELAAVRTELKADIAGLRTELKADIAGLRTEFKSDLELLRRDLVIKLGGMLVISVGVLLTAIRYLPPHQ